MAGASGWVAGGQNEVFCHSETVTETCDIIIFHCRTGGGTGPIQPDASVK